METPTTVTLTLTEEERLAISFLCGCALDDLKKEIKKLKRQGKDTVYAEKLWVERFKIVYGKLNPEAWCGTKESLENLDFNSSIG